MKIQDSKSFGKTIRAYRKQQGMTQKQLSAMTNVGTRFIVELENGKPTIQLNKALYIAWMLGISFEVPEQAV